MKRPPSDPEFTRFTDAMRRIMKVSKADIQKDIQTAKRKPKTSAYRAAVPVPAPAPAGRASASRPKPAN